MGPRSMTDYAGEAHVARRTLRKSGQRTLHGVACSCGWESEMDTNPNPPFEAWRTHREEVKEARRGDR